MTETTDPSVAAGMPPAQADISLGDFASALLRRWRVVAGVPILAGAMGLGTSYLIAPTFTARTTFLPPHQQQSGGASALASLGALAGIAGGARNTGDQFVSFAKSRTIADRMIERFQLQQVYKEDLHHDTLIELDKNTRVSVGRKDGLIVLEVDDHDPKRAADMATAYVEELRKFTAGLALTEAQQRRVFFEGQLKTIRQNLEAAQLALQGSGISAGAIRAEPKATAESFAKLKAEATTEDIRLQAMRRSFSDQSSEVQKQLAVVQGLRDEIARQGRSDLPKEQLGYIGAYRDFKYQEALFDLIARQYELARVDESRDGGQLQVVDIAHVPERKTKPKRSQFILVASIFALLGVCIQTFIQLIRARRVA